MSWIFRIGFQEEIHNILVCVFFLFVNNTNCICIKTKMYKILVQHPLTTEKQIILIYQVDFYDIFTNQTFYLFSFFFVFFLAAFFLAVVRCNLYSIQYNICFLMSIHMHFYVVCVCVCRTGYTHIILYVFDQNIYYIGLLCV